MTYYEAHSAERLEYQREYNKKNRAKYLEYQRQYYILNHVPKPKKPPVLKALPVSQSILYEKRINKNEITISSPFHISFT